MLVGWRRHALLIGHSSTAQGRKPTLKKLVRTQALVATKFVVCRHLLWGQYIHHG